MTDYSSYIITTYIITNKKQKEREKKRKIKEKNDN